ncbi:hypothetical protein PoB_006597500 [Plakobranchus ocellatus]|uniref:Uncharacterized protein n=1 Tax=Plakobranchus ocellatus TaxID=259542 RepID=A0AAV4D5V3_9GAST|nr:hypothetical protein PoB_006597500 [Plakobranchus ocellatus]
MISCVNKSSSRLPEDWRTYLRMRSRESTWERDMQPIKPFETSPYRALGHSLWSRYDSFASPMSAERFKCMNENHAESRSPSTKSHFNAWMSSVENNPSVKCARKRVQPSYCYSPIRCRLSTRYSPIRGHLDTRCEPLLDRKSFLSARRCPAVSSSLVTSHKDIVLPPYEDAACAQSSSEQFSKAAVIANQNRSAERPKPQKRHWPTSELIDRFWWDAQKTGPKINTKKSISSETSQKFPYMLEVGDKKLKSKNVRFLNKVKEHPSLPNETEQNENCRAQVTDPYFTQFETELNEARANVQADDNVFDLKVGRFVKKPRSKRNGLVPYEPICKNHQQKQAEAPPNDKKKILIQHQSSKNQQANQAGFEHNLSNNFNKDSSSDRAAHNSRDPSRSGCTKEEKKSWKWNVQSKTSVSPAKFSGQSGNSTVTRNRRSRSAVSSTEVKATPISDAVHTTKSSRRKSRSRRTIRLPVVDCQKSSAPINSKKDVPKRSKGRVSDSTGNSKRSKGKKMSSSKQVKTIHKKEFTTQNDNQVGRPQANHNAFLSDKEGSKHSKDPNRSRAASSSSHRQNVSEKRHHDTKPGQNSKRKHENEANNTNAKTGSASPLQKLEEARQKLRTLLGAGRPLPSMRLYTEPFAKNVSEEREGGLFPPDYKWDPCQWLQPRFQSTPDYLDVTNDFNKSPRKSNFYTAISLDADADQKNLPYVQPSQYVEKIPKFNAQPDCVPHHADIRTTNNVATPKDGSEEKNAKPVNSLEPLDQKEADDRKSMPEVPDSCGPAPLGTTKNTASHNATGNVKSKETSGASDVNPKIVKSGTAGKAKLFADVQKKNSPLHKEVTKKKKKRKSKHKKRASSAQLVGWPKDEKRRTKRDRVLISQPKTYYQLGLAPLVRSRSSENTFHFAFDLEKSPNTNLPRKKRHGRKTKKSANLAKVL